MTAHGETFRKKVDFPAATVLQARGTLGVQQIVNNCVFWIFINYFYEWQCSASPYLCLCPLTPQVSLWLAGGPCWREYFWTFRLESWSPSPPAMRPKTWWHFSCVRTEALHSWVLSPKCVGPPFYFPSFPPLQLLLTQMIVCRACSHNSCILTKILHILIPHTRDPIPVLQCAQ